MAPKVKLKISVSLSVLPHKLKILSGQTNPFDCSTVTVLLLLVKPFSYRNQLRLCGTRQDRAAYMFESSSDSEFG